VIINTRGLVTEYSQFYVDDATKVVINVIEGIDRQDRPELAHRTHPDRSGAHDLRRAALDFYVGTMMGAGAAQGPRRGGNLKYCD
jgi:hypothetical protein